MKEPLIEERGSIQDNKFGIPLDVGDDLWVERQEVGVRENYVIELLYVDHCSAFPLALSIKFPNNEDREAE